MTAYELADYLDNNVEAMLFTEQPHIDNAANLLREQADLIEHYKNKADYLDKRELELLAKIRSLEKSNTELSFRAVYAEKTLHMIERHYDQLDTQLHPQTKPLSDNEIDYLVDKCSDFTDDNDSLEFRYNDFARAIEEKHGIK